MLLLLRRMRRKFHILTMNINYDFYRLLMCLAISSSSVFFFIFPFFIHSIYHMARAISSKTLNRNSLSALYLMHGMRSLHDFFAIKYSFECGLYSSSSSMRGIRRMNTQNFKICCTIGKMISAQVIFSSSIEFDCSFSLKKKTFSDISTHTELSFNAQ